MLTICTDRRSKTRLSGVSVALPTDKKFPQIDRCLGWTSRPIASPVAKDVMELPTNSVVSRGNNNAITPLWRLHS